MLIAAFGLPAALPELEFAKRGYKGHLYQTHGAANNDFLRIAGKSAEGTFLTVGPLLVADQFPLADPVGSLEHVHRGRIRPISPDCACVPEALKMAKPGTKEFRTALHAALVATDEFVGTQGVYNMSPSDHVGLNKRARYMVENGIWNWCGSDFRGTERRSSCHWQQCVHPGPERVDLTGEQQRDLTVG